MLLNGQAVYTVYCHKMEHPKCFMELCFNIFLYNFAALHLKHSIFQNSDTYTTNSVYCCLLLFPYWACLALKFPSGWVLADFSLPSLSLYPPPGSDVVEWLFHHIEGFQDRREARKYASNLLKAGFIRHTVNKITFSEQCYYVFGDLSDCENCELPVNIDFKDWLASFC